MYIAPPRPRAVLFDFFGTLTHAVSRGIDHAYIARSLGVNLTGYLAALDRTFYQRASGRMGPPLAALRQIVRELGVEPDESVLAEAIAARVGAVRRDTTLRPDAVPVLAELRQRGLRTALVSDCWYELPAFLPDLPVAPLLNAYVYSLDVGYCKPHPAMYLQACVRLRVDPDECLYVGDGGSRELLGAENVGMRVVRLAAPDLVNHLVFNADTDWSGPAVSSLTDVIGLLDRSLVPV